MTEAMRFEQLEAVYETLALAIDKVGAANEALLLTKLVFLLARQSGDLDGFNAALEVAMQDLPPAAPSAP